MSYWRSVWTMGIDFLVWVACAIPFIVATFLAIDVLCYMILAILTHLSTA